MRLDCLICKDIILQDQDVSATPCGHTFHTDCVIQWIKVSKSCPQCRTKATKTNLIKLYFDLAEGETEADPDTLQHEINNMKFQLNLKEQEANKEKKAAENYKVQVRNLVEEVRVKETMVTDRDTQIRALKTQLLYKNNIMENNKKITTENNELKRKLALFENVKTILKGTEEEVSVMVNKEAGEDSAARNIATFCTLLKQELSQALEKRDRALGEKRILLRKKNEAVKEIHNLKRTLEGMEGWRLERRTEMEELMTENRKLKVQIRKLEETIASPSDEIRSRAIHRLLFESPAPDHLRQLKTSQSSQEEFVTPEVVNRRPKRDISESDKPRGEQKEEDSEAVIDLVTPPSTPTVSKERQKEEEDGIAFISKRKCNKGTDSMPDASKLCPDRRFILTQHRGRKIFITKSPWQDVKPKVEQVGQVGYDGLGGHHKPDVFPKPKPSPLMRQVPKKSSTLYRAVKGKDKTNKLTRYFENTFED